MLKIRRFPIKMVYVPSNRAKTLDGQKVLDFAEDILEHGQKTPIRLRADGKRFVLVEGYHRLEALHALGEEMIEGVLLGARLH